MKMKLSRERIILGGVLLAAAGGLLADQVLFASESTPAVDDVSVAVAPAAAVVKSARPATIVSPEQRLAERLAHIAGPAKSADEIRDVFSDGSSVRSITGERRGSGSWSKRVLNGVLFGADGKGVAIIDGRMVPVGTRLDGMRLTRVTQTMAVFTEGTSEIVLRISQRTSAGN